MSKGVLEFDLPEERQEFELAQKAVQYIVVIEELDNYLRGKIKYQNLPETEERIYQEIRDKLRELQYE